MPCVQGDRGINRPKNRFVNVLPFDHTRFTLQPIEGTEGSDYVNANFVSVRSRFLKFACYHSLRFNLDFKYTGLLLEARIPRNPRSIAKHGE